MAKKPIVEDPQAQKEAPPGQLGDWLDKIPEPVQEAADDYAKKKRAAAKAKEKQNVARYNVIEKMKEHGLHKIRIDDGEKWLVCEQEDKLKIESHKKNAEADD